MKIIGREIMWNLSQFAAVLMYSLLGVVVIIFAWGLYERIGAYRRGRTERENRLDNLWDRTVDTLKIGLGQQKVLERKIGGLTHLAIFSAFIVLFLATCLVAVEYDLGIMILDGNFYIVFKLFANTFGLLLLAGIAAALVYRYIFRPEGLTRDGDDLLQLLLIGAIGVTGFLVEAVRIAATRPSAAHVSYVSNAIASLFENTPITDLLPLHRGLWWTHLLLAFGFLATIPFSKMHHLGAGVVNIFLRTSRPKGALQPIPDIEEEEKPGVVDVEDFSWKQLLSSDACTKCGLVPSAATLDKKTGRPVVPSFNHDVLIPDEIWACTTCRACMEACPVLIEHIDMIVDVRRGYIAGAKIPDTARTALRKMSDTGNPWGLPQDDRIRWADGLSIPFAAECLPGPGWTTPPWGSRRCAAGSPRAG
jgi:nitrate reductase gamma subunit